MRRFNNSFRTEGVLGESTPLDESPGSFPLAPYAGDANYKGGIVNQYGEQIGDSDNIEVEPPDSFGEFEEEGFSGFDAEQAVASAQQNLQESISDFMAILKNFLTNPKVLLAGAAIGGYLAYKKGYLERFIR